MSKKEASRKRCKKKNNKNGKIIAVIIFVMLVCAEVVVLQNYFQKDDEENSISSLQSQSQVDYSDITVSESSQTDISINTDQDQSEKEGIVYSSSQIEDVIQESSEENDAMDPGYDLEITRIDKYAGIYYEAGDDRKVDGVLMIEVTNTGDEYIQYAEITLTGDSETANFNLSTLFPGESMVVLEKDMKPYFENIEYTSAEASNVAVFSEVPSLCEDKLQIQQLDGAINVINISEEAIDGEIVIYYKNYIDGLLQGGITYRIRISDGLDAGEIRQIMADHFSGTESRIMFVTCG